jgi:hypothetical protein
LTNFGLRVLFIDALARLETKQELYGEALVELNRRMLVIAGKGDDGGTVVWPDILPVDETIQTATLEADQRMGIVSKKTISTKRGYEWEDEKEALTLTRRSRNKIKATWVRCLSNNSRKDSKFELEQEEGTCNRLTRFCWHGTQTGIATARRNCHRL